MRKSLIAMVAVLGCVSTSVLAKDEVNTYPIQSLLETTKAKDALNKEIKLYFADQKHPEAKETYGEVVTNKKTNAFMKSDSEACEWVMLSALKALQHRAKKEGMNAVVGIESYYKKRKFVSAEKYECGNGNIMAGVALKGTLVKL